jgi:hypothetical protein
MHPLRKRNVDLTKGNAHAHTPSAKPMKFDTPGRKRLRSLKIGPSDLTKQLNDSSGGELNSSTVSRWLSGDSRPESFHRALIKRLWRIEETDWLLHKERIALAGAKGAA